MVPLPYSPGHGYCHGWLAVGQAMDQPGIGMEGEDDGFILGEDLVEIDRPGRAGARIAAAAS